ncbi:hypothetical protein BD779DRAFT_22422 [Infundibulicybe gibba]|nr:hypothetical protein BD779DRAFT_22422 [Infundibulicybe gibba]
MDHGSDTESEAGSLQGLHNSAGEAEDNGHRVGSHSHDTSEPQTIVQYSDVALAIRRISQIDISAIREDSSLHQVILHSSGAIIDFLDNPTLPTDIFSIADLFSALVDVTFLSVLFEQRIAFHGIASETVERGASRSAVICWVDVVLAKLGSFALNFAGGFSPEFRDEPISITLRSRWEGECVRAASQLPQQWTSVVHVITSTHASPAAKRLSLRLMFAAYVMGPQLKGNDSWGDTRLSPSALINTLCGSLESADATPRSHHNERQQTTWALTISIFAACCTFQNINGNTSGSMSPLRPRSLGQLLLMIQAIFNFDRPDGRLVVNPVENMNLPQIILIRWGKTVPWCWEMWEDQRIADVECTTTLSATWFFHVDTPFLECVPLPNLADSITRRPTSASSTVRNVLHCIVSGADSPNDSWCMENLSPAAGRVLSRSCWAAVRLLQINIERYDAKITAHTPDFCRCLIIIFCLLGANDGKYEVMDLVLEGLTIVGPVVLHHCLKALQEHSTLQFNARLDKSITEVKKLNLGTSQPWSCMKTKEFWP